MMGSVGLPELVVVFALVAGALLIVWPTCRICRKAGFSPWLGLLALVPIANGLLLWFLALEEWPAFKSTPGGA